jgi:hypothetical protein
MRCSLCTGDAVIIDNNVILIEDIGDKRVKLKNTGGMGVGIMGEWLMDYPPNNEYIGAPINVLVNEVFYFDSSTSCVDFTYTLNSTSDDSTGTEESCTDSDGGRNYYVKGVADKYYLDGNREGGTDSCNDNIYLEEQYCLNNFVKEEMHKCPNGCFNGACVKRELPLYIITSASAPPKEFVINANINQKILELYGVEGVQIISTEFDNMNLDDKIFLSYSENRLSFIIGTQFDPIDYTIGPKIEECLKEEGIEVDCLRIFNADQVDPSFENIFFPCPEQNIEEEISMPNNTEQDTTQTTPSETESSESSEPETTGTQTCNGCLTDDNCYTFGYRKSGKYCNESKIFLEYKISGETCENNFECKSNLCVDDECISGGMFRRILNWFRRVFGGE